MNYSDYLGAHDDFVNRYRFQYGNISSTNTAAQTASTNTNGQYASGISDKGFVANTCTDGVDDGKIGIDGVLINLGEGILKGFADGITGMFTDSNGNFSLAKTLTTVAIGGLCVAFPAVGVAACAIGAVSGGAQIYKGFAAMGEAKTDAEAKAIWENIGAGGSTVVGCVLGAKASVGAMKNSASLSSIDDIANTAGKSLDDILGSANDLSKVIDNSDDAVKAASKLLKSKGVTNADDILKSIDDATDAAKILDAVKNQGKSSALDALKMQDKIKFTDVVKAFGKDALSSTKNNGVKLANNVKNGLSSLQSEKSKIQSEINSMKKALENVDDADEAAELSEAIKLKKQMLESADDSSPFSQAVKEKFDSYKQTKQNVADAQKNVSETSKALKKAKKSLTPEEIKASPEVQQAQVAYDDAIKGLQTAKSQTPFGQLTSKSATYSEFNNALKTGKISEIIKSANPKTVLANLKTDGVNIYNYLCNPNTSVSQAVNMYGYDNTMEVLKVIYAINQTNSTV